MRRSGVPGLALERFGTLERRGDERVVGPESLDQLFGSLLDPLRSNQPFVAVVDW